MANSFAITSVTTEPLKLDTAGRAITVFTVTNTTGKPLRGIAKVQAVGNTKQEWLSVNGEKERDFPPGGTQQYTIIFDLNAASGDKSLPPAGKYEFRLNVASVANSDEDFTEGQIVAVEIVQPPSPTPKPFPWWIVLIILGVLLIGALILFLVLPDGDSSPNSNDNQPLPTPVVPTPSPTSIEPSPTPPSSPFSGSWRNQDTNTGGITRIIISQENNELRVHPFGKCHPTDCDWGAKTGGVVGGVGQVVFDQGFAIKNMQIIPQPNGELKVIVDTVFNDDRPRQHFEYIFIQSLSHSLREKLRRAHRIANTS